MARLLRGMAQLATWKGPDSRIRCGLSKPLGRLLIFCGLILWAEKYEVLSLGHLSIYVPFIKHDPGSTQVRELIKAIAGLIERVFLDVLIDKGRM